jgi:hypothetical protein
MDQHVHGIPSEIREVYCLHGAVLLAKKITRIIQEACPRLITGRTQFSLEWEQAFMLQDLY